MRPTGTRVSPLQQCSRVGWVLHTSLVLKNSMEIEVNDDDAVCHGQVQRLATALDGYDLCVGAMSA